MIRQRYACFETQQALWRILPAQSFSNSYETISSGRHSKPNLFISVVAVDGDNVHVRLTMRKLARALRSINMISAVVFQTSTDAVDPVLISSNRDRSASRHKSQKDVPPVPPYCLTEQQGRSENHRTVTCHHQAILFGYMHFPTVQISDGQIAALIVEKFTGPMKTHAQLYKFKKMLHFLAPKISQLTVTLRAFGFVQIINAPKFFVPFNGFWQDARSNNTVTNKPALYCPLILGNNDTSIAGLYSLRSLRVSSRNHIDTIVLSKARIFPLGTWYCDGFCSDVQGDEKSIDHPEALYDPDLSPISDLDLACTEALSDLANDWISRPLSDGRRHLLVQSESGKQMRRGDRNEDEACRCCYFELHMRCFTVLVAENYSEGVEDPRVDYDHDGTCSQRPTILAHVGHENFWRSRQAHDPPTAERQAESVDLIKSGATEN
ncbi:hypothetical protein EDD18DRAFT_1104919 [Armillaria luteobubalina]|uniref:Uncharacterized protein n=1 Tax=Armillaria luteobubalina TaxID=153913 RepID=A0AA39Q9B3_9AGAR|nr:hypothetical protein EDD18DRAFT_1104919 [Armillaria luteobubalina]